MISGHLSVINSLKPSDMCIRHSTRSSLIWRVACCLFGPSHYLNQCWRMTNFSHNIVIISESSTFPHENAPENVVCNVWAIMIRPLYHKCQRNSEKVNTFCWLPLSSRIWFLKQNTNYILRSTVQLMKYPFTFLRHLILVLKLFQC